MAELEKTAVLNIDGSQAQTTIRDLTKQMKELKNEMTNVEEGSAEFYELANAAAEVKHQIDEINSTVKYTSADFGDMVGNASKSLAGLVGAVNAVKGTMTLLGVESESVEKAIQKMQAAMAIVQGLSAIDQGIKAFKGLSVAIKAASASLHGFKAALAATGIGLAIVAVGTLAANYDRLKSAIFGSNKALEEQKKLQMQEHLQKVNDKLEDQLDLEEKIRKAAGQSDVTIARERVKTVEEEIKKKEELILLNRQETAQAWMRVSQAEMAGKHEVVINDLRKKANAIQEKEAVLTAEINDLRKGKLKTAQEELEVEEKLEAAREIKRKQDEAERKKERAAEEARRKREEAAREAQRKADEAERKRKQYLENLHKEYDKLITDIKRYGKADEEVKALDLEDEKKEALKTLDEAYKAFPKQVKNYQEQRRAIIANYDKLIAEESKKMNERLVEEAETARQESVEKALSAVLESYDKLSLEIAKKQQEASAQMAEGNMTEIKYEENVDSLEIERIKAEIAMYEEQLKVEQLTAQERLEIETNLVNAKIALDERSAASAKRTAELSKSYWSNAITVTSSFAGSITSTLDAVGDMMEKGSVEQKAIQTTSAIISTLVGIMQAIQGGNAMAAQMGLAAPIGWAMGAAQAAATLATGIATIAQIHSANENTSLGGASASISSNAVNQTLVAPVQYTQAVEGAQLESAIQDTRVYVVESDITNTQDRVKVTENEASF